MTICLSQEGNWCLWTVLLWELCSLMWDLTSAFSNLQSLCTMHCASVCPWCVFLCPCAWTQPHPPVWSTKINRMARGNSKCHDLAEEWCEPCGVTAEHSSEGPYSLPSPTVTSSALHLLMSVHSEQPVTGLPPCTGPGVSWGPCSCRS